MFFWICVADKTGSLVFVKTVERFNPCFSGYAWLIEQLPDDSIPDASFQSLFFWICVADSTVDASFLNARKGFNPCFSGYAWLIGTPIKSPISNSGFNPCFSGYAWLIRHRGYDLVNAKRFNPCFSGYAWLIHLLTEKIPCPDKFQSLFFWICVADLMGYQGNYHHHQFQSLFFWICVADWGRFSAWLDKRVCFNPCFSGYAWLII